MISLTPSTTPQDTNGAFALFALLTDPAAAKKRLDELTAAAKVHQEALTKAQNAQVALDAKEKDLIKREADLPGLRTALAAREAKLTAREKIADEAHIDVTERDVALTAAERAHTAKVEEKRLEWAKREAAIVSAEREAAAKLAEAFAQHNAAMQLKSTYEQRLAKITAAAQG